jgi:hypothetical protein
MEARLLDAGRDPPDSERTSGNGSLRAASCERALGSRTLEPRRERLDLGERALAVKPYELPLLTQGELRFNGP